ncbi:MAG: bifunctional aspartate transaminase/aspartate 4-decarboxylase [Muribaculaceae bacterium]|nr:bifunctional aspartate transaminase/aspartate 4-decarboxylase [Muribaculaceae bacterium]
MDNLKNNDSLVCRDLEKKLESMSPFEIKNRLIELAQEDARKSTSTFLNAGRGNPNWIATIPREAFFLLGKWGIAECRLTKDAGDGIAGIPTSRGSGARLRAFLREHEDEEGAILLRGAFDYLVNVKHQNADDVAYEWAEAVIGDQYPTPDRILPFTEILVRDYLAQEMGGGMNVNEIFDLFAVEGGTAGMCYAFDSLQENYLLNKGDKIALMTPIFTPYIEIPTLDRFSFDVVNISANRVNVDGFHQWQYPDEEIDRLRDKNIKLLCLVNPSNPPSYMLAHRTIDRIVDIVKHDNPNLMIVTDDVYGTFVEGFRSLMYELPHNTMCVYSFSKYFGATGWRLAVMAVNKDNIFDKLIAQLPDAEKAALRKRYGSLTLQPDEIKFVDRLVADSRLVALNHTAGLSTPQQMQMSLFAAYALLDRENVYKKRMQQIIHNRLEALWKTSGFTLLPDETRAGYYSEIDIMVWARKLYGEDFAKYLNDNFESLDFVMRLAQESAVVLLNGDGFAGPLWSVRASLANLDRRSYLKIGVAINKILNEYYEAYRASKR